MWVTEREAENTELLAPASFSSFPKASLETTGLR